MGRPFSKESIYETEIMLPIDDEGEPDYVFMEDYIKSFHIVLVYIREK